MISERYPSWKARSCSIKKPSNRKIPHNTAKKSSVLLLETEAWYASFGLPCQIIFYSILHLNLKVFPKRSVGKIFKGTLILNLAITGNNLVIITSWPYASTRSWVIGVIESMIGKNNNSIITINLHQLTSELRYIPQSFK
jgi:hypothetical protein